MTLDNRLLFGIVLICLGLALAAVAYLVFTSRNSKDENEEGTEEGEVPEAQMPELEPHQDPPSPPPDTLSTIPEPQIEGQRRITIATLLREEVTGELIVRVDDREYLNVHDLISSDDMTQVEYAVTDLAKWFPKTPLEQPAPELNQAPMVEKKPQGMIEQINAILKEKLTDPTESSTAVRLIEDPGGAIRVLVGVKSYNLDDVPDDEVKKLIRDAVNAWEESQ